MRILFFLIRKEFLQIFRNKTMLPLLTVVPIVQLFVLSFAATHEIRNIRLAVIDQDQSQYARRLQTDIFSSGYFIPVSHRPDQSPQALLDADLADLVLVVPADWERDLIRSGNAHLQVLANAINGSQAGVAVNYLNRIIRGLQTSLLIPGQGSIHINAAPDLRYSYWYNPTLDYKTFMVPGILGVLVTILALILSAMNIVREREIGTMEQINVSPIKKYQFLLGKLIPFLLIGLFDLTIGLVAGKLAFDIPMVGSLWLVFTYCSINLMAVLGLGLFISTFAETQQQAMFIAWFFMVIFILMSGLFTPIESMPEWAQWMTIPNPIAHFVEVMRRVLLKGSDLSDILPQFLITGLLAVCFNSLAVITYRKTS